MLEGFPHVTIRNCIPTSDPTEEYNCVGWAVHSQRDFIWPDEREQFSWPIDMTRDETVPTMRRFFEHLGFAVCGDSALEAGFEKIAIYGNAEGVQHVARQKLRGGMWTSKMGEKLDVDHTTPEVLSDYIFGTVQVIMKRRWNGPPRLPGLRPPRPKIVSVTGAPLIR
jgi:hypothetical protein